MHRYNGPLRRRESSVENVIMRVEYEFRMLQLDRENAMAMLRVYASENSNLEATVQHLTNDIVLATERNRALERRIADLECRPAERRATPDDIDKKNEDT